ncbi:MAG: protein kinase [Myxococcota bacterium]
MAATPERIDKYRILRAIGTGAQGAVFLAQRDGAKRLSVVKRRHAGASDARFRREARATALLSHPNIARLEGAVFDGADQYLAFEFVPGVDLASIIERHAELNAMVPVELVIYIVVGALLGLEQAHKLRDPEAAPAGLIHRDLNLSNVLVGFDGVPRVIDFGLTTGAREGLTAPGTPLGTPNYMPPEFVGLGAQAAVPASDVYSMGLLTYDLLLATHADVSRVEGGANEFWRWVAAPTPLPRLADRRSDVSPALSDVIHRAFAPAIADRWPTAEAFRAALLVAVGGPVPVTPDHVAEYLRLIFPSHENDTPIDPTPIADGAEATPTKTGAATPPRSNSSMRPIPLPEGTQVVRRKVRDRVDAAPPTTSGDPKRRGRYELLQLLAEGGMGQVHLARRDGSDGLCVLKTLRADVMGDDVSSKRFVREAQLAAYLAHPNIARLLDAGVEDGTFCIAFEYVAGKDIESMMHELRAQQKLLPYQVAVSAIIGILDGLDHAHNATGPTGQPLGVVHRDLSPRNMMLTFEGTAKVIDFGVARASLEDFKTAPGMVMGTFRYVSPEMARASPIDRRSDVYATGVVLYELLSGFEVVPHRQAAVEMLRAVVTDVPAPLAEVNKAIPIELSKVVMQAIEKSPAQRWQSAAEFRSAIVAAVPEWANTPRRVLAEFLRTWFKEDAARSAAIVELGSLGEPGERTRTVVLEDALRATIEIPVADFSELEEQLATRTGLVFPEVPEPTRSVVMEPTRAAQTRLIDARSQPGEVARLSEKPSPPPARPRATSLLVGAGLAVGLAGGLAAGIRIGSQGTQPTVVEVSPTSEPSPVVVAARPGSPTPSPIASVPPVTPVRSASPRPSRTPEATKAPPPSPPVRTSRLSELAAALRSSNQASLTQDPAFKPFVDLVTASLANLPEEQRRVVKAHLNRLIDTGDVARVSAIVGILEGSK